MAPASCARKVRVPCKAEPAGAQQHVRRPARPGLGVRYAQ